MRILLDHCIPQPLRHSFPDRYSVETAFYKGWEDLGDRELLDAAESEFDVFITLDGGIYDQQPLDKMSIGVVLLKFEPPIPPVLEEHSTNIINIIKAVEQAASEEQYVVAISRQRVDA